MKWETLYEDLPHGANYGYDHGGGEFSFITVTELEGACGADGLVLVEASYVWLDCVGEEDTSRVLAAYGLAERPKDDLTFANLCQAYGLADPASDYFHPSYEVVLADDYRDAEALRLLAEVVASSPDSLVGLQRYLEETYSLDASRWDGWEPTTTQSLNEVVQEYKRWLV